MFGDILELITYTKTKNEIGDTVKTPNGREVYCDTKSVRDKEFYQAAATGHLPEIVFEMRKIDYQGEQDIEYSGRTYRVIRAFSSKKNSEMIELVCEGAVNSG